MVLLGGLVLVAPTQVEAGIFAADEEVTYKEYWIDHSQFTGGCNDDGTPTNPSGSWYSEPGPKCDKVMAFTLPDDFTNALKIELYLDLWRNYAVQAARFKINDKPTVYQPPVGYDWSRTPYVVELPLSEFKVGANTITFFGDKMYHVHDVAIRIYYDDEHPLVAAPGGDVTPPDAELLTIQDDSATVDPAAGGVLMVNKDTLKFTASTSPDAKYVEFHAWYEGYDEDNDAVYRDWHNLGRNNWWPGGKEEQFTGGTINHIGTVKPKDELASVTWTLPHVTNQPVIRFKLRVVDAAGNVREAPGGVSADFQLKRSWPVNAFIIHDFTDFGLHMDGNRADTVDYSFDMPPTVASFNQAYLVGAYWRNPYFAINGGSNVFANSGDAWALGIKTFNKNGLVPGKNKITYSWSNGSGHFIEEPGPMFVLRRTTDGSDATPPEVSKQVPAPAATGVDVKTKVIAHLGDTEYGVDWTSIKVSFGGQDVTKQTEVRGVMGDYRLVYDPPGNLDFDTDYTVIIEACDLAGNCMNPANYKFRTAPPDKTPPVISDLVVVPQPNGANISWKTNEPASTRLDYGKTKSYELGTIEETGLLTNHSVQIRGLQPETVHHFRIIATDEQKNDADTGDQTFETLPFGSLLSDDFNACTLKDVWTFTNPKNDASYIVDGTALILTVPPGVAHDWNGVAPNQGPPRIMQDGPSGDFSVDMKFDSVLSQVGQSQGILIQEDTNKYLRISFEISPSKGPIMFARFVQGGTSVKDATREFALLDPPLSEPPPYMRVKRTGDSWEWFYSSDGTSWKRANLAYTFPITTLKVGFFASNTGAGGAVPGIVSAVDYFFNGALPISPEDGTPIDVHVNIEGSGSVTKAPDKSWYACGEEVLLTAASNPGWTFEGWSGDINETSPSTVVTVDEAKSVTATFTQDQYTLDINYINNGTGGGGNTVNRDPDKATYVYGDVVQLTAAPLPGWKFVGWSGAATGPGPVTSVAMFKSEAVTATFEQEQYSLNLNVVHNGIGEGGSVTVTPSKPTYVYGDTVTLKANVKPGWLFKGWSGDVNSTATEVEATFTGPLNVTATYEQIKYQLTVNVVGGGSVLRDPEKAYYVYGDVVALSTTADECWSFNQWADALAGSNSPVEIVTITGDMKVTAVFLQKRHTLTIQTTGPGSVTVSPQKGEYLCGEDVTLTAVPANNFFFSGWSGDLLGGQNPVTFPIKKNSTIMATFSDNPPPTVDPIADRDVLVDELVTFQVIGSDPQGEPVTLTAQDLPPGASFKDNGGGKGTFSWRPGITQAGEYTIVFTASDGQSQGSASVTIVVSGQGIALPVIVRP